MNVTSYNVTEFQIKCCDRCQRQQPLLKSQVPELHPIPVDAAVWCLVGMDLIGPLKKTSRGNQYVLTMTCYFSKWVEACAIPDKTAVSVASAIYSAYCRHGAPNNIITDQGREFVNEVNMCLHHLHVHYTFNKMYWQIHVAISNCIVFYS